MIRSRAAVLTGAAASVIAIVTTVASADGVRAALADAYSYPNAQGVTLGEAASMTLTYLFVVSGAALVVSALYLFVGALSNSMAGWWLGAAFVLFGLAVAIYNSSQAFPLAVKIVFFLPPLAGILWLALPNSGSRQQSGSVSPA